MGFAGGEAARKPPPQRPRSPLKGESGPGDERGKAAEKANSWLTKQ